MDITALKNYGRPMDEVMLSMPTEMVKGMEKRAQKIVKNRLGLMKSVKLLLLFKKEKRRMHNVDISAVREKGLKNEAFIDYIIDQTAIFSAMSKIVGIEEALDIHYEVTEELAFEMMSFMMPEVKEFQAFDDPLAAAKDYILATMKANREVGIHETELIEDSKDAFQVNVTYCAFCEIPKLLGIMEAARPSCYGDDVFFPPMCEKLGLRFLRDRTLARGDDCCDFRFER